MHQMYHYEFKTMTWYLPNKSHVIKLNLCYLSLSAIEIQLFGPLIFVVVDDDDTTCICSRSSRSKIIYPKYIKSR